MVGITIQIDRISGRFRSISIFLKVFEFFALKDQNRRNQMLVKYVINIHINIYVFSVTSIIPPAPDLPWSWTGIPEMQKGYGRTIEERWLPLSAWRPGSANVLMAFVKLTNANMI